MPPPKIRLPPVSQFFVSLSTENVFAPKPAFIKG
jgi:hypothetical protein